MAGLIPDGQSVPPPQAQAQPQAPQPPGGQAVADPTSPDSPQNQQDPQSNSPAQAAVAGHKVAGPHAIGTVDDANEAIQQQDPTADQQVTPVEQKEYDDFLTRFMQILADRGQNSKHLPPGQLPPHDAIVSMLNNPKTPLAISIGNVTAKVAWMIVKNARMQKVVYSPDVLFHAGLRCVSMVFALGSNRGLFKGVPPFKGMEKDGQFDFDPQEQKIITDAYMQAVRIFGDMEMKAGQLSPQIQAANMSFWKNQIQREIKGGRVNDRLIGSLAQKGVFKHSTVTGQQAQPPQQQALAPAGDTSASQVGQAGAPPAGMPGSAPYPGAV